MVNSPVNTDKEVTAADAQNDWRTLPVEEHPLRQSLHEEIHARPSIAISVPALVSFVAYTHNRQQRAAQIEHLQRFTEIYQLQQPADLLQKAHQLWHCDDFSLKWEHHNEFSSYTFYRQGLATDEHPGVLTRVDSEWLHTIPGCLMSATHLEITAPQPIDYDTDVPTAVLTDIVERMKLAPNMIVSSIGGRKAVVATDFRIHQDQFSRYSLIDLGMNPTRLGRTVQRLFEIEIYRQMALLAFPVAKTTVGLLRRNEKLLADLIDNFNAAVTPEAQHLLLEQLIRIAAEIEHSISKTAFRFGAASAYHQLVQQRITELKEQPINGYSSISGFMHRRLTPAMNTCASVDRRQNELSSRIARTSQLLRTRVDIELERQNQQILAQMNQRALRQLHIQEAVEGLSVVVLTYYGSQLVQYLAKGSKEWHHLSTDLITALSIPLIALLVAWWTRRIHHKILQPPTESPPASGNSAPPYPETR